LALVIFIPFYKKPVRKEPFFEDFLAFLTKKAILFLSTLKFIYAST